MSEKRKRAEPTVRSKHNSSDKRQKRGFVVGPDNLPDGAYKRKNQEIKRNLIGKAKIKKEYAKVKRGFATEPETLPQPASLLLDAARQESPEEAEPEAEPVADEPVLEPHPDRQDLINGTAEDPEEPTGPRDHFRSRAGRPKPAPFQKEYDQARQRKADAEAARKAREEAMRERAQRIEERQRFRRAMAKARTGGPNGQRKLGRESQVLLEKVKRMVGGAS